MNKFCVAVKAFKACTIADTIFSPSCHPLSLLKRKSYFILFRKLRCLRMMALKFFFSLSRWRKEKHNFLNFSVCRLCTTRRRVGKIITKKKAYSFTQMNNKVHKKILIRQRETLEWFFSCLNRRQRSESARHSVTF